ncbi:hypothetical protein ASPBRDRAFT_588561 [Aspergillus brasiliensis CBS 101740]|uniref:Uncharacterized protein n=1 Tax=Aspergillus brasiliensis (strain CBS 101740 / IMI 381727 / IBT 21946) TaxID=767769 RepID=A0A1L9UKF5_ASPBC|nr:hypothetical protein ASPBRDRAFT_588561 [Aspergillus brasiliensis CBS 101740]
MLQGTKWKIRLTNKAVDWWIVEIPLQIEFLFAFIRWNCYCGLENIMANQPVFDFFWGLNGMMECLVVMLMLRLHRYYSPN